LRTQPRRAQRIVIYRGAFALAFFLFQSFAPASLNNLLVLPLTVDCPAPAEVAVVHGSGLGPQGEIRVYAAERLDCALDAYRKGLVHHIILSGGTRRAGSIEAVAMRDYLLR
jgi:vancomycin permeability regulator SanA